ncbi:MAG: DMT family transporter [Aminobacterium sp.]|uniref:DMT family transporter n=1 Tax=unclassified Aminobacterium TaxID=2685012 RepID=UPI001BD0E301|nr:MULTISPECIES: DMT family transporter [unclassified Aminobacterium]MDD2207272.1 DMT family transporter [Aminobacterium sp.]MDD3425270.1 DMT family transporter [Aminobacterium sp.]MDD3707765.1 DMT family transporter [Aminobacterium sp.]MDD4552023.1 DMT family transporter [Aminobacterium sp.]MEA4877038.1 DMT family transporter [Aminobacterium sp.]
MMLGLVFSVLAAMCWATSPLFLKRGMRDLNFFEISAIRSIGFLSASFLIALVSAPATLIWHSDNLALFAIFINIFIGNIVGDTLYFRSIQDLGISRSVAISSSYPLVVTAVSYFWLNEHITFHVLIGTVLIVLGLICMRGTTNGSTATPHAKRGYISALVAALCWGISIPITKWAISIHGIDPISLTFWRAAFLMPSAWILWRFTSRKNPERWHFLRRSSRGDQLSVLMAGSIGLAVGGYVFALAMNFAPVSVATPITASSPFLTAIGALIFMREHPLASHWAGMALIISGSVAMGV